MSQAVLKSRLPAPGASADALFQMGLKLSMHGEGGIEPDSRSALALFDLAARFGSIEAKIYRRELSVEMEQADIDEARKIASEWLAEA